MNRAARTPGSFVLQVTAPGSTASEVRVSEGAVTVVKKAGRGISDWPRALLSAIAASLNKQVGSLTESDCLGVTQLTLDGTSFDDESAAILGKLTNLQSLSLDGTQATDAGLPHLATLTNLRSLSLTGTQVTDAGLAHIGQLTNLQYLGLNGTPVTDAGLAHVGKLTNLRTVWLNRTQVTGMGIKRLREALPQCTVTK